MKFGVREVADITFKAKSNLVLGKETFEAGEPVIFFDSAKTSTMESAAAMDISLTHTLVFIKVTTHNNWFVVHDVQRCQKCLKTWQKI